MPDIVIPNSNPDVVELPKAFPGAPGILHPDQIDYANFNNNPALKRASDALKRGFDEGNVINELRTTPNDEHRAAQHDRVVRERVDASERSFCEQFDGAWSELKAEHQRVSLALEDKAGLKSDPNWRNAVVGTFQDMPNDGARAQAVAELIERGDHASLAALVEAPLVVTRLKAEVRDTIKTRVFQRVDPQGLKLRDHLASAIDKMDAASLASPRMFGELRAGTEPGAWKARAAKAAARTLAANFSRG